jgi:hypothetical protein
MPALQVDNAALLRIIWAVNQTETAVNVYGVAKPPGVAITQGLVEVIGTNLRAMVTTSGLVAQQSPTVHISRIGLRDINVPNQPEFEDTTVGPPGLGTDPAMPPQIALVVTMRTALAGRRFRGRSYVFGWAGSANEGTGIAAADAVAASSTWITSIQSALTNSGLDLAIVSRPLYSDAVPPVLIRAGEVHPVTAILTRDNIWDTQRRRAIPGI